MTYNIVALSIIRYEIINILYSLDLIAGYHYCISPPGKKAVFLLSTGKTVRNNFEFIAKKITEKYHGLVVVSALSSGTISIDMSKIFKNGQKLIDSVENAELSYNAAGALQLFPSEREMEILRSVCEGLSSNEIACIQHRSVKTVEVHRYHMLKKFKLKNSIDLVKFAIKNGYYSLHEVF